MAMIPSHITMFPEASEVFANRVEEHARVLFPVFSVDLHAVNPAWTGKIHMLQFNEDSSNEERHATFNEYCRTGRIGFDVIDGKYSFKTDLRFFECTEDGQEWFEKTKTSFAATKQRFLETGQLITPEGRPGKILERVREEPESEDDDDTPLDPDGDPMTFIANIDTENYTDDSCDKDIYLFYSEAHQIAVLTYASI